MELLWNQTECNYLQTDLRTVENMEETLEIRIGEAMPDIGRVIGAWGQPMLRGKEWRGDSIGISGGTKVTVLYAPEDGSQMQCVEGWIPFQGKWKLPHTKRDGTIRVQSCLRSLDARILSSRKMMVRASVGLFVEALESTDVAVYHPEALPAGVQVLTNTYPAVMAKEAGEKTFSLEERLMRPETGDRMVFCRIFPEITETETVGNRLVFRGECHIVAVFLKENGELKKEAMHLPFAQFAQLENTFEKDAQVQIVLTPGLLETETEDDGVQIQCNLIAQYVICGRQLLQITEDAYSPYQETTPIGGNLRLPAVLDREIVDIQAVMEPFTEGETVDVSFFPEHPVTYLENGALHCAMGGAFQVLFRDAEGRLQCRILPWDTLWELPMEDGCEGSVELLQVQPVEMESGSGNWIASIKLEVICFHAGNIPMVMGLELGEMKPADPNRPSLILCRMQEKGLWEIAKATGSTVEAIEKANLLDGAPIPGQMLLIPLA